jgi:hypothetical protein
MVKKLTAAVLCVCFIFIIAAHKDTYVYSQNDYQVWGLPTTTKVMLDETEYPNKRPAAINLNVVKNEYESYQIYISATERNIESYYLEKADLSDGKGNKISKDNIDVYNIRFIPAMREEAYEDGWYPDALIPIDLAKRAGELNIKKGTNGAIWVTFYIPKNTPAGTYTAKFKLQIENKPAEIPVSIKVNDYVLTDKINAKSNYAFRPNHVVSGELDNTPEMREAYYEFFLDYRIALWGLPVASDTPEENAEYALKYFDKTPCYHIQPNFIPALAAASTPEKNLLSKASLNYLDEIYMRYKGDSPYSFFYGLDTLRALHMELQGYVNTIENDRSGIYDNFKQIPDWQQYILRIPNVVADHFDQMVLDREKDSVVDDYLELLTGYCPIWTTFSDNYRDGYLKMLEDYGAESWWYGCLAPTAPYATYHIPDKNLLSARTISWMQKKYNVLGTMYWGTAGYTEEEQGTQGAITTYEVSIDVYNDPYRIKKYYAPAGDGILCYPGAAYGHYGPLPSIRLMSIRDGYEEYEMLLDLENSYKELAGKYSEGGDTIDVDAIMDMFYSRLYFNGIALYQDGQSGLDFYEVRNELIDALLDVENPCEFMMYKEVFENVATVTVYVNEDYKIKVDGNEKSPVDGKSKYVFTKNLSEGSFVEIEVINKTDASEKYIFNKFLDNFTKMLYNFNDDIDVPEGIITAGSGDSVSITTQHAASGNALECVVSSRITDDPIENKLYVPYVRIPASLFDVNFTDVSLFKFYVYNDGGFCNMYVKFYSEKRPSEKVAFPLVTGVNEITLSVQDLNFSGIATIDTLSIEFDNAGTKSSPTVYTVYLDNFYAIMK